MALERYIFAAAAPSGARRAALLSLMYLGGTFSRSDLSCVRHDAAVQRVFAPALIGLTGLLYE